MNFNNNKKNKNLSHDKSMRRSIDITCPYNFVKLNKKVIFPEWSGNIYHDIPFKDGLSGEIKYSITAKSPILISSGKGKEAGGDKDIDAKNINHNEDIIESLNNKPTEIPLLNLFCKDANGNYFIPGTSLKGVFRSLLEILSFSRLSIYDDYAYSYRDLYNDKYKKSLQTNLINCGWLTMTGEGDWKIQGCGKPGRISHEEIDKNLKTGFVEEFGLLSTDETSSKKIPPNHKSAKYKYESFFKKIEKGFDFNYLHKYFEVSKEVSFRTIYSISNKIEKSGTIVFTGQASVRNANSGKGKWLEFIFFENQGKPFNVSRDQVKNFKSAYFNNEPNESEDWKFWKSKQKVDKNFKIPVFFVLDNNNKVSHFGLSQLYKLPYKFKISDLINGDHKEDGRLDFAQCLFGFAKNNNEAESGLKGRIQFRHAFISKDSDGLREPININKIMSSPHATFFPFYLTQYVNNQSLLTYDDSQSKIAGFKRYPIHLNADIESIIESKDNRKLLSKMRPLPEGTVFEGSVSFHNLKPKELGALLSALTFNDEKDCFHTLGCGKPFGFGKTKVLIKSLNIVNYEELKFKGIDYKAYISIFNEYIKEEMKMSLSATVQYKELIAMAREYSDVTMDKFLKYMVLDDFAKIKKGKCSLKSYSSLLADFKNKRSFKCMTE